MQETNKDEEEKLGENPLLFAKVQSNQYNPTAISELVPITIGEPQAENLAPQQMDRSTSILPQLIKNPKAIDSATSASNLLSLLQEPFKKRRGRKPKAYYEQKALLEQQLAEQRAKEQADINEAENEEEVMLRQNEYRKHPLYNKLELFDAELGEFI